MTPPLLHSFHPARLLPAMCAAVLLLCAQLSGQPVRPTENIALLDSLVGLFSAAIVHDVVPDNHVRIAFSDHPAADRLRRVPFASRTSQSDTAALRYYVADFGIRYFLYDNDADSLVREASLWLSAEAPTLSQKKLPDYNLKLRDTIARSDLPFVESNQFDFARAPVPDKPSDFYSDIAEPLVVVSAAVITILLLFTVRSQ